MGDSDDTAVEFEDITDGNSSAALYPFDDPAADLVIRTPDGKHFYVHKLVLSLVSPVFAGMFTLPAVENLNTQIVHDGHPCVDVDDDGDALYKFLVWCDPRCSGVLSSLEHGQLALNIADKYGAEGVIKRIGEALLARKDWIIEQPIKLYALAIRHRWEELARLSALESLLIPLEGRRAIPEFQHITGLALQRLYDYHASCALAATKVATQFEWFREVFIHSERSPLMWSSSMTRQSHAEPCIFMPTLLSGRTWRTWWYNYMVDAAERLNRTPRGSILLQAGFLSQYLEQASQCAGCRQLQTKYITETEKFNQILADRVELEVSKIPLIISF
ncbi:hypothetical protein BDQ12DRAFT_681171 [Crucibulum laeve]|uniref:BTB domain-containing protein n=1 Tax=Crucibulum laeve TaxID=68775 RepID=A0A5C3M2W5_9AGAR|nr:hypothetical protein BDQ12DRAFT_681171 [Crucibulum laeve]